MTLRPNRLTTALCALLLCLAGVSIAEARDYRIEIVLFENLGQQDGGAAQLYFPHVTRALGLASPEAASAGFALVDDGLTLADAAQKIADSNRYRLLRHFAWRQPGLDDRSAQPVRVNLGESFRLWIPRKIADDSRFIPAAASPVAGFEREITTTTVNGTLTVSLGRFLHLDALLVFTDASSGRSYRLDESRKMRSRELHFLDNPRFGLLARILPVEDDGASPDDALPVDDTLPADEGSDDATAAPGGTSG